MKTFKVVGFCLRILLILIVIFERAFYDENGLAPLSFGANISANTRCEPVRSFCGAAAMALNAVPLQRFAVF